MPLEPFTRVEVTPLSRRRPGDWQVLVAGFFAGTSEYAGGYLAVWKGRDGAWLAAVDRGELFSGAVTKAEREARHARREALRGQLEAAGVLIGEASEAEPRLPWLAGRGRTRDEAAKAGARAAVLAKFLERGLDPARWLADARAKASALRKSALTAKANQEARERREAQKARERALNAEIAAELLRVDAEGLLEGSNALAGLKQLADRLKAARADTAAAADGDRAVV